MDGIGKIVRKRKSKNQTNERMKRKEWRGEKRWKTESKTEVRKGGRVQMESLGKKVRAQERMVAQVIEGRK